MNLSEDPPDVVVMDASEPAYTVLVRSQDGAERGIQTGDPAAIQRVPTAAFIRELPERLQTMVLRNEYPSADLASLVGSLLLTFGGTPVGVTWNGGIAITATDYRVAVQWLHEFRADPDGYIAARKLSFSNSANDPLNPGQHGGV